MQTINVKYLPAGNVRGARMKATASGGASVTISYPHEYAGSLMYWEAAKALRAKLNWTGPMIGGGTKDGMIFVFKHDVEFPLTPEIAHANRIPS